MNNKEPDHWDSIFYQSTPLFWPIIPAYQTLKTNPASWPNLSDYNHCLNGHKNTAINTNIKPCINNNDKEITFVSQGTQCNTFEEEYEPRIYCSGEVQTRLNNWHDFFQVMVWKTFPKTKALLNEVHYRAAIERHKTNIKQRGPQENFVTLFDECGSIVISNNENALALVKNFEWNNFFVENKNAFGKTIDCIVFGHAMYEKALKPYIGMTSHCLLLIVEDGYFELNTKEKTDYIDDVLSNYINSIENLNTKCLTPLPILGIPDWHPDQNTLFYANKSYFRAKRENKEK